MTNDDDSDIMMMIDDDDRLINRLTQLKAYLLISRLRYLCGSMWRDTDKIGRHDCDKCEDTWDDSGDVWLDVLGDLVPLADVFILECIDNLLWSLISLTLGCNLTGEEWMILVADILNIWE